MYDTANVDGDGVSVAGAAGDYPVVLFVDDDEGTRDAIRTLARDLAIPDANDFRPKLEFLIPETSTKALSLLHEHGRRIDVLATDILMPTVSGSQLIEYAIENRPEVATIAFTALDRSAYLLGVLQRGINFLLVKPFSTEIFLWTVHSVLTSAVRAREYAADNTRAISQAIATLQERSRGDRDAIFARYLALLRSLDELPEEQHQEMLGLFEKADQAHAEYAPNTRAPWMKEHYTNQGNKRYGPYSVLRYYERGGKQRSLTVNEVDAARVSTMLGES